MKKLIVALVIAGMCTFTLGCGGGTTTKSGSTTVKKEEKKEEAK